MHCSADSSASSLARPFLLVGLLCLAAAARIVPHPWNITPLGAMALFGGAHFADCRWAVAVPFAALLIGDVVTGFHALMPFVYVSFAVYLGLGFALRQRCSAVRIAGAAGAGAVQFYLVTNFGVWLLLGTYPMTAAGLVACYAAGLPYLGRTLLSDLLFSAVLFGSWALAARRWSVLRRPARRLSATV